MLNAGSTRGGSRYPWRVLVLSALAAAGLTAAFVLLAAVRERQRAFTETHPSRAFAAPPQQDRDPKLGKGQFLVAGRELHDRNFGESVVLLVGYNQTGTMGLIINRETRVRLPEILPEVEALRSRADRVFMGGPVSTDGMMLLIRARNKPPETELVFGDVYISSSRELLAQLVAEGGQPSFRAYVGYAGWSPGQLEMEIRTGSWQVMRGSADVVFDPAPAEVWPRLIERSRLQFAMARPRNQYGPRVPNWILDEFHLHSALLYRR